MDGKRKACTEEPAGRIPPLHSMGSPVHRGDGLALKNGWGVGTALCG